MAIVRRFTKKLKGKGTKLDPRLLICVECGSDQVEIQGKKLECKNCGIKRAIKKPTKPSNFEQGQLVRIVEYGKPSELVFKIRKVRKSEDGGVQYLIKSDESEVTLLYQESVNSHLEKAK